MTLHLGAGNNPSKLYAGSQEVQKVYHGSTEVWSNVVAPVGDASAEISIVRRSALGVAPEGFVFEIINLSGFDTTGPVGNEVYDATKHDLHYKWNFDDNYTFSAPENTPAVHKNAGIAYGPWVSHTYRAEGTYEPTCTITEPSSGKSCVARLSTTTMTVGNPDTQFATTNTIFMSPSGNFANAPAGADTVTSGDIASVMNSGHNIRGQQTVPKRLMLNRGESYTFSDYRIGINPGDETPSLHIVSGPGGSGRPEVACTGAFNWSDIQNSSGLNKDFVVQGIDWTSPAFNAETETGNKNGDGYPMVNFFSRGKNSPTILLLDQCNFSGFNKIMGPVFPTGSYVGVMNDCIIENWRHWGVLESDFLGYAFTGCRFTAPTNAYIDSASNGGAPIRLGGTVSDIQIVDACDLFSRQGWSGHNSSGNIKIASQGCVRFNTGGYENARISLQRSALEGGFGVVSLAVSGGASAKPVNALVEKNYVVGGYQTFGMVASQFGGTTLRNNIILMPDSVGREDANNPYFFIEFKSPYNVASNLAAPVRAYNNTLINRVEAADYTASNANPMREYLNNDNYSNLVVANNVNHQTDTTTTELTDAPLAQSANNFFSTREAGYRSTVADFRSTTYTVTTAGMFDDYRPLPGSAALDSATGLTAYDDFYGTPRGANPDRGAIEA